MSSEALLTNTHTTHPQDSMSGKVVGGLHTVAVDVLNPRLAKFRKHADRMACMVLFIVAVSMGLVIYYTRNIQLNVTTGLVALHTAALAGGRADEGLCETYTTQDVVLHDLLLKSNLPAHIWLSPTLNGARSTKTKVTNLTSEYGWLLQPIDSYTSVWAPLMQGRPVIKTKFTGKACSYNLYGALSPKYLVFALHNVSLEQCLVGMRDHGYTTGIQYYIHDSLRWGTKAGLCQAYSKCSHEVYSFSDVYDILPEASSIACSSYLNVWREEMRCIHWYRQMFQPMRNYGALLGLAPPSLEDSIYLPNNKPGDIKFSDAFVNFTAKLHELVTADIMDFNWPCELQAKGCENYTCFGRSVVCDTSHTVMCGHGAGQVSMTKVNKPSWLAAVVAAVALSHNLEILASGLVVLTVVYICMRKEDRDAIGLQQSELSSIIFEKPKVSKRDIVEADDSAAAAEQGNGGAASSKAEGQTAKSLFLTSEFVGALSDQEKADFARLLVAA